MSDSEQISRPSEQPESIDHDAEQSRQTSTGTRVRAHRLAAATQSQRRHVPTPYFASESLILAFLFTIIVLFVPSLFYHISKRILDEKQTSNATSSSGAVDLPGDEEVSESNGGNDALQAFIVFVLSYIPRVSVVVTYIYRLVRTITYPIALLISLFISVFQPVFVFLGILLQGFVVVPFKALVAIIDFLYPVYVFVGVACLAGGLVGLGAATIIHFLRLLIT